MKDVDMFEAYPLVLSVGVITTTKATEVGSLVLVTQLSRELTECPIGTVLALRGGNRRSRGVEVWRLLLAEVRRMTTETLLRRRRSVWRLHCRLVLVEVGG